MIENLTHTLKAAGVPEHTIMGIFAELKPDASRWSVERGYLRTLLDRANIGTRQAADLIGISSRALRHYISGEKPHPYSVQYCLEVLAELNSTENRHSTESEDDDDR
jgi:hypothetical protein